MMSVKQKESKLFYNFSLSSRVPKDHFLRSIEETIDFSFVHDLARPYYSHTGQPGIDPVVLLKMMLIGYLYDITSERKLAQDLKVNLAFMYFLGYDIDEETPNHSVLSKARRRFGARIFEEFFEHLVEKCNSKGLIQAEKAFIDSSLIPANASLFSIVDCGQRVTLKRTPKEYLKKIEETNPADDEEIHQVKKDDPKSKPPDLPKNKTCYSKTDPDASLIRYKNRPLQLAYKQHISVDSGPAKVITACSTTTAAVSDEHKLTYLISKAYERHNILPKEVGADTKYGTADNYRFLLENAILPSVPHHTTRSVKDLWGKDRFIYNKEKDQYRCPRGRVLKLNGFIKDLRHIIYRAHAKHCKVCKYHKACTSSSQGRSVIRHVHESAVERAKEHLKTIHAKLTINERSGTIENVFASEKKDLGLKRAKFRGLTNVTIQSLLTATTYNLRKLVKYAGGSKQKLKEFIKSPILPPFREAAFKIAQTMRDSEGVSIALDVKKRIFLFFRRIRALNFA